MLIGLAFTAQAQDISKNALVLRFGDSGGFGAERRPKLSFKA